MLRIDRMINLIYMMDEIIFINIIIIIINSMTKLFRNIFFITISLIKKLGVGGNPIKDIIEINILIEFFEFKIFLLFFFRI